MHYATRNSGGDDGSGASIQVLVVDAEGNAPGRGPKSGSIEPAPTNCLEPRWWIPGPATTARINAFQVSFEADLQMLVEVRD